MHIDAFSWVLLGLVGLVGLALIGRVLARLLGQASVLFELVLGVVIGNFGVYFGSPFFERLMRVSTPLDLFVSGPLHIRVTPEDQVWTWSLWIFGQLGIILLLFLVGFESSVHEMKRVGPRSALVALVGVIAPTALSYAVSLAFLPTASESVHLFMAATCCATSVGITARVLKDLGQLRANSSKIILGAAVIDDVLGLIILAVVAGLVKTGQFSLLTIGSILIKSILFFTVALATGPYLVKGLVRLLRGLETGLVKLFVPLCFCFLFSYLAQMVGLASIVGAFTAGLMLSEEQFSSLRGPDIHVAQLLSPLESLFAPMFFLMMGMQVKLSALLEGGLALPLAFTAAAILGKMAAGLAASKESNRLIVGIGMIPRGEVGLIFAAMGRSLGVLNDQIFSSVVIMVILTTFVTPPALAWQFKKQ